jgi:putative hydrolase
VGNQPFGFGTGGDEPDEPGSVPPDPFSALFGSSTPADLGAALQHMGRLLQYSGGPVNWDLARDLARQEVMRDGDPSVSDAERRAVDESVRLAETWLDPVTEFPAGTVGALAWSRSEWVEQTRGAWQALVDPVASRVVEATSSIVPPDAQAGMGMAGPMLGMMKQLSGAMFGAQVGQGLGRLATEVLGATDIGLPLGPEQRAALVPRNVAAYGAGLGIPADDVRLDAALREAAHQRLFAHVPWLRAALLGAVEEYARGIAVDTSRLEEVARSIDPTNPQALQEILESGMFEPADTPAQKSALTRLETLLALVAGWVDVVVADATRDRLPSADALRETARRRRATGGPAEQTFSTLVGLELRPRRLREAAELWTRLTAERGVQDRDALWSHPDLLPTADDLEDSAAYLSGDRHAPLDLSALESAGEAPEEPEPPQR